MSYLGADNRAIGVGGVASFNQFAGAARVEAAAKELVAVTVKGKGARKKLVVGYRRTAKAKEESDECELYATREEIVQIFMAILSKRTTSKRRKAATPGRLLEAGEVALRSPALFWSVYHLLGNPAEHVSQLVEEAAANI
eukprot:TRINITY_DN4763_c0_g1_i1.p1 TRINITY_DN4763_c0_g1~~TRINITY_DN4763_c0_g1_i1.p1  ORF type:complete len:140 (+),score=29.82 TRINITY_DN4763_c0_g1_i1:312-731(+)